MSKVLTVYYSRKGQNYCNGSIKELSKGNTEVCAEYIHDVVGGDIFEIEPTKTYSRDYYKCIDEAKKELQADERPEVKQYLTNIDDYDTIFIGYPNWWGTCPMVVFTFLEHYNLQGKKIVPFCTNEGSGMGSSERDLKKICNGAIVEKGLSIHGTEVLQLEDKVKSWAKKYV